MSGAHLALARVDHSSRCNGSAGVPALLRVRADFFRNHLDTLVAWQYGIHMTNTAILTGSQCTVQFLADSMTTGLALSPRGAAHISLSAYLHVRLDGANASTIQGRARKAAKSIGCSIRVLTRGTVLHVNVYAERDDAELSKRLGAERMAQIDSLMAQGMDRRTATHAVYSQVAS